ncbi:MAG: FkbM family methyltransferase [Puniceicoccales bacterium]|jgi:FkbM family methyltransferase|nr:FkbM family methyltransferase [Puniceicoccales bacterium]
MANGITITGHGLNIFGRADNTLWTAAGVLSGEYDFGSHGKDFVVIDIGLNIGLTSLYLARKNFIKKVYSFEPFKPIFDQAKNNMKLNPQISSKIEIFNFGLSDHDGEIEVAFNPDLPGQMSTIIDKFADKGYKKETATLEKASKILIPIFARHGENIMLKIDCEGGEREIIPDLAKFRLLGNVSVIIMECHDGIIQPLEDLLKRHGFNVRAYGENREAKTGMLYGERQ